MTLKHNDQDTSLDNSKRHLLKGVVAATAVLATGSALASGSHQHHQHHDGPSPTHALADTAAECIKHSELCLAHCIELFKLNDTTLAKCSETVNDTLSVCATLLRLAASESPHLNAYAEICIAVNRDCEKECRKHEKKHDLCKTCADSCADCIKACKALLDA